MYERELKAATEHLGRIEEQHSYTKILFHNKNIVEEKLDDMLEKFDSEELNDAIADFEIATVRLSAARESNSWILALGASGISHEVIVNIWDKKIAIEEELKESEEDFD